MSGTKDVCDILKSGLSITKPPFNDMYPYKPPAVYSAMLENNPGRMVQNYPWMITPNYTADANGIFRPSIGQYVIYHRNFGRFLSFGGNSNGVETGINVDDYKVWNFEDINGNPINLTPATMVSGTYLIKHSLTGQYLCGNPGNHVFLTSTSQQWKLTIVQDVLQDVFYVQNISTGKYITALGDTLTTLKAMFGAYLPAVQTGGVEYNFLCQSGYDQLLTDKTSYTDCCGSTITAKQLLPTVTPQMLQTWRQSLANWPCMEGLPSNSELVTCYSTGRGGEQCQKHMTFMNYVYPGYGDCVTNWTNSVLNNTRRTPCEPYAYFPDPDPARLGQQRQIPIPSATYLACLTFQQTPPVSGTCLTSYPYPTNGVGRNQNGPSDINVSARDYCVCNCMSGEFGIDQATCQSLCAGTDPNMDASTVLTSGYQWDATTQSCINSSVTNKGQFATLDICNNVVKASPNGGGGGGGSGGSGIAWWQVIVVLVLLVLLILGGVYLDARMKR